MMSDTGATEHGRARSHDPSTSHDAASGLDASRLELLVYHVVRQYGPPVGLPMCVVEIHNHLPFLSIDTISPRMIRLVEKRLLRMVGKQPRANRHDNVRKQQVYQLYNLPYDPEAIAQ